MKENNIIIFDSEWLKNSTIAELMTTCLHETRHSFQWNVINNRYFGSVVVNPNTIKIWAKEFMYYNIPSNKISQDFEYLFQDIEIDAIAFSYKFMLELLGITISIPEFIQEQVLQKANNIIIDN